MPSLRRVRRKLSPHSSHPARRHGGRPSRRPGAVPAALSGFTPVEERGGRGNTAAHRFDRGVANHLDYVMSADVRQTAPARIRRLAFLRILRNPLRLMRRAVLGALFPRVRGDLLAATLLQPEKWWYLSELAKFLGAPPSSLQRELGSLVES